MTICPRRIRARSYVWLWPRVPRGSPSPGSQRASVLSPAGTRGKHLESFAEAGFVVVRRPDDVVRTLRPFKVVGVRNGKQLFPGVSEDVGGLDIYRAKVLSLGP